VSDELKPCPFCGSEGYVNRFTFQMPTIHNEARIGCTVHCVNKECHAGTAAAWGEEQQAIDAWNRRVAPAAPSAVEPPKCEECESGILRRKCINVKAASVDCRSERDTDGHCGPEGKLFRAKVTP
jgi:hypothetical protein